MIEHAEKLNKLCARIKDKSGKRETIILPLSLRVRKRCIQNECFDAWLNFIDLQILTMSIEIDGIYKFLEQERKQKMQERGISSIEKVSGTDSLKYL